MQELSSESVTGGNCLEGPIQCPLLYDNAASFFVYPEFYKGFFSPGKGPYPEQTQDRLYGTLLMAGF